MEQYADVQQLMKKEDGHKDRKPIYPPTVIQAVIDGNTGASLEAILAQFNSVYVQYQGTPKDTRLIIPMEMRRAGLTITYMDMESNTITERANSAVQKDNDHWGLDVNWSRVDELSLSGDISVSAKGTWIINGKDTGVKAVGPKGDTGLTPWLKTIDNKLHFSYDNVTWEPCSDYIAGYFRVEGNKLQISRDKSTWENVSDFIAAWFRWNDNKIQISRDNKTWTDFSGKFADNVHIKGYVANYASLPTGAAQGDIYGVGPTYAAEDTAHTNPIYRYYVRNANSWVDNGAFTSISAGVVQKTGDSETEVMSQKAVSTKLFELALKIGLVTDGAWLDGQGNLIDDADWFVVEYTLTTPVKEGDVFVWSGIKMDASKCIVFYKDDKFVSARSATGPSRTFTIAKDEVTIGANKIRASFLKSETSNAYITQNGLRINLLNKTKIDELESASLYGCYKMADMDTLFKKGIYIRDKSETQNVPQILIVSISEVDVIQQTRLEGSNSPILVRKYKNGAWSNWSNFIVASNNHISFIPSANMLPNFDTINGVLDLGEDPIICIGRDYYAKDVLKDYRNIPIFDALGYATSTLEIYFNTKTYTFSAYTVTEYNSSEDDILFLSARIDRQNRRIISVSAPFEYTVDGEMLQLSELSYNFIKGRKLMAISGTSVYDVTSGHTDYILIENCNRLSIDTCVAVAFSETYDNAIVMYDANFNVVRALSARTIAGTTTMGIYDIKDYNIFPNDNERYIRIGVKSNEGVFTKPSIKAFLTLNAYYDNKAEKDLGIGQYNYYGEKIVINKKKFQAEKFIEELTYTGVTGQGMTIYDDYLFQGGEGGYLNIYNLKNKELAITGLTLASSNLSANHHCNNLCFGIEQGAELPYMYISECTDKHRLFVEDISLINQSSRLVQTIQYNGEKLAYEKDWLVDVDNGFLYALGNTKEEYNAQGNNIGFAKFRLPSTSEGDVVFSDADIIEFFEISGKLLYVYQGSMYFDGKIFLAVGGAAHTHNHDVCVIDLTSQNIISRIPMNQVFATGEIEGIAIYEGNLILAYPNQEVSYRIIL